MVQGPSTSARDSMYAVIAGNLQIIRHSLDEEAQRVGRNPREIRLIAVSKTMSINSVEAAVNAGHTEFGENTVQDALTKIPHMRDRGLTWHFIGHLQSNKAKLIPGNFNWVHSIDCMSLAQKLSDHCARVGARINVLVQVNITGDPKKHGVVPESTYSLVEQLLTADFPAISLRGLMTMGPYQADQHAHRECFAQLRMLREGCIQRFGNNGFRELSMGMTADFPIAIAEGATMVRIGTAIFGPRSARKL